MSMTLRWRAEWMKLPKSLLPGIVIPAVAIVAVKWLGFTLRQSELISQNRYSWQSFLGSFSLQLNQMMKPLLMATLVAYLYQIEQEAEGWKLCLIQPTGRRWFFGSKIVISWLGLACFMAVLAFIYLAAGAQLFNDPIPWSKLTTLWYSGCAFLTPVLVAQHLLTLILRNPFAAVGVCLCGNLMGTLGSDPWRWCLPWFYPSLTGLGLEGEAITAYIRGGGLGLVLLVVAWILMMRKDV